LVLLRAGQPAMAIECKWRADEFDPAGMKIFRSAYPEPAHDGEGSPPPPGNLVVSSDIPRGRPYTRRIAGLEVRFVALEDLAPLLAPESTPD